VLIHDDPIHTYHEVVLAVHQTVPGKSYADGWAIATLVDTTGQAVAAVCAKEIAEYYRERFEHRYGLTSTIEPA
jgi:ATP-dependent Clp protease adapter protein ClpS